MAFYSFVVFAPSEVQFPSLRLLLEPGVNTFNVTVRDIDEFTRALADSGVRVIREHRLDEEYEPVDGYQYGNGALELAFPGPTGVHDEDEAAHPFPFEEQGETGACWGNLSVYSDEPEADGNDSE